MGTIVNIKITGLNELKTIFNNISSKARANIQNEMRVVGSEWETLARRDAPKNRGRMAASSKAVVSGTTISFTNSSNYSPFLEFGTGRQFKAPAILGSYPSQFKGTSTGGDPIGKIAQWVKDRRLNAGSRNKEKGARSIAYAIFKKRMKFGSKPRPFLYTGADGSDRIGIFTKKVNEAIDKALRKLL